MMGNKHQYIIGLCSVIFFNASNYAISRRHPCHNQGGSADKKHALNKHLSK